LDRRVEWDEWHVGGLRRAACGSARSWRSRQWERFRIRRASPSATAPCRSSRRAAAGTRDRSKSRWCARTTLPPRRPIRSMQPPINRHPCNLAPFPPSMYCSCAPPLTVFFRSKAHLWEREVFSFHGRQALDSACRRPACVLTWALSPCVPA